MSIPMRVQMSRRYPWREKNPDAIIVARPSVYGNPFRVSRMEGQSVFLVVLEERVVDSFSSRFYGANEVKDMARSMAAHLFEDAIFGEGEFGLPCGYPTINEIRHYLSGHPLACWCPLDKECHADTLISIANGRLL